MTKPNTPFLILLAGVLGGLPSLAAGEPHVAFTGDAAAGYRYDSNVNLADLDANTGQADAALLMDLGLGAEVSFTDSTSLKLGYDVAQTVYHDFAEFDLVLHRASASLEHEGGMVDTGLSLQQIHAVLGGEGYLDMRRLAPSVSKLFGGSLYLRGAWIHTQKDHQTTAGRSATNRGYSADAWLFLDGADRYVRFGYAIGREDAANDDYDYDAHRVKLAYSHRLEWRNAVFESGLHFEQRDYGQILQEPQLLASNSVHRADERLRARIGVELPITDWLGLDSAVEYTNNASNLQAADFDEMIYSLKLAAAF